MSPGERERAILPRLREVMRYAYDRSPFYRKKWDEATIRPQDITRLQDENPDAEFLVHPECGCASQCMAFGGENTHILSTEGMINFAKQSPKERFLIATETGIIHRLQKEAPEKRFEAVSEKAICRYMKMITLEKLRGSLRDWKHVVTVPEDVAARARIAIDRMVATS
jgi:quinolinate synthase